MVDIGFSSLYDLYMLPTILENPITYVSPIWSKPFFVNHWWLGIYIWSEPPGTLVSSLSPHCLLVSAENQSRAWSQSCYLRQHKESCHPSEWLLWDSLKEEKSIKNCLTIRCKGEYTIMNSFACFRAMWIIKQLAYLSPVSLKMFLTSCKTTIKTQQRCITA